MTETTLVLAPTQNKTTATKAKVLKDGKTGKAPKPKGEKKPVNHPSYGDMVVSAIKALSERNGSSRQAISKYILANYNVGTDLNQVNTQIKLALKRAVTGGKLKNSKGKGASGSFKITESAKIAAKAAEKAKAKKKIVAEAKVKKLKEKKTKSPSKKEKKPKASAVAKEKKPKAKKVTPKTSTSSSRAPKEVVPKKKTVRQPKTSTAASSGTTLKGKTAIATKKAKISPKKKVEKKTKTAPAAK